MTNRLRSLAVALALAGACGVAAAHPGHGGTGFTEGLLHPMAGWDHLLAMLAVGLWSAAALPAARRGAGPLAFLLAMAAGALAAQAGAWLPQLETGVAASVVLLGLMLAGARPAGAAPGLLAIAAAGLLHGMAHGAELPSGALFAAFAGGFLLSTALLHAVGLAAGGLLRRAHAAAWQLLAAGTTLAGLALMVARA